MSRKRRISSHALHFIASVLMTSGILLLFDAGLTLAVRQLRALSGG